MTSHVSFFTFPNLPEEKKPGFSSDVLSARNRVSSRCINPCSSVKSVVNLRALIPNLQQHPIAAPEHLGEVLLIGEGRDHVELPGAGGAKRVAIFIRAFAKLIGI